jgi:hypothetical protein
MSHHFSAPDSGFPQGDARLDLTDLFAFPKPGGPDKSILIMDVHPSVGENPQGPTTTEPFAPEALYELKIDTDGDAVADIAYRVRFSSHEGGQTATLRRVEGTQAAGIGEGGQVIVEGAPVSTGREARVTAAGDHRFFAGWRSDPFFFDRRGAQRKLPHLRPLARAVVHDPLFFRKQGGLNDLTFTGADFFADKNVCSIVLEVPNSALGSDAVGLWHRTLVPADGPGEGWAQVERGARPLQLAFVFALPEADRDAYATGEPADDARFVGGFVHTLQHKGRYPAEEARRLAATMLPEIMPYAAARPASFPDNGRTLTDDAADSFLTLYTGGKVTGDKAGPHSDLLADFPYVGPPHSYVPN